MTREQRTRKFIGWMSSVVLFLAVIADMTADTVESHLGALFGLGVAVFAYWLSKP